MLGDDDDNDNTDGSFDLKRKKFYRWVLSFG